MTTETDRPAPARPLMNKAELATHQIEMHGRNYYLSDDGYGDIEVAAKRGWQAVAGWGSDGWDLGDWPYVVISIRDFGGHYQMQQVVEGDHDVYSFDTAADREAAIDYLFLWYAHGEEWLPPFDRRDLDDGTVTVDDKYRGSY